MPAGVPEFLSQSTPILGPGRGGKHYHWGEHYHWWEHCESFVVVWRGMVGEVRRCPSCPLPAGGCLGPRLVERGQGTTAPGRWWVGPGPLLPAEAATGTGQPGSPLSMTGGPRPPQGEAAGPGAVAGMPLMAAM